MLTIYDIAEKANVSIATVSRYFNSPELLRSDTFDKIDKVVKENNYVPNSVGCSLRISRSGKILVVLPTVSNPIYQKMLSAMCSESEKHGYTVVICTTDNDAFKEKSMLSMLESHYVDGAVLLSTTQSKEQLEKLNKRFPIVQCCECTKANISGVAIDNEQAAFEAAEYLIRTGHKRIAMASGTEQYNTTFLREEGLRKALNKYHLPWRTEYLVRGEYGFSSGERAVQKWLTLEEIPDAVITISDAVAIGVIRAFAGQGILAGRDISVIGFDNTTLASKYMPSVSSVKQPRAEMGRVAIELLFERMKSLKSEPRQVTLPHSLIIRDSVKQIE